MFILLYKVMRYTMPKLAQYVIGGAVRDTLLGNVPNDVDYLWVGATPEDMSMMGFTQVGADFPVFLDPCGNEHALARTEKKTGKGYYGFECTSNADITLLEDQLRRDITINQLAVHMDDWETFKQTLDKSLVVDGTTGLQDLEDKLIRANSKHFSEDPLRVLRVARFAARYGFFIHNDFLKVMTDVVSSGELDTISVERSWTEISRGVCGENPETFVNVMQQVGWKWNNNHGVEWLPNQSEDARLLMFFSKTPETDANIMLSHFKASSHDTKLINMMFAIKLEKNKTPSDVIETIKHINGFGDTEKVLHQLTIIKSVSSDTQSEWITGLMHAIEASISIDVSELVKTGITGKEIGDAIKKRRMEIIEPIIRRFLNAKR